MATLDISTMLNILDQGKPNMNAQGLDAQGKEDQMEKTDGGATSPLQHGVSGEEYRYRMAEYQISAKGVLQQRVTLRQMSIPTYILKEDGTLEEKLSEEVKRIDDHLKMIAESLFKEIVINGKNH